MPLNLKIENETSLPDGGPLGISVTGRRNIETIPGVLGRLPSF